MHFIISYRGELVSDIHISKTSVNASAQTTNELLS
jgi:hypothetical protein